MKVTKTWDLSGDSEYDEKRDLYMNDHALEMALFIGEFKEYLRKKWKYPPDKMSEETFEMIEKIRERYYDIAEENDLNLDKLGA